MEYLEVGTLYLEVGPLTYALTPVLQTFDNLARQQEKIYVLYCANGLVRAH